MAQNNEEDIRMQMYAAQAMVIERDLEIGQMRQEIAELRRRLEEHNDSPVSQDSDINTSENSLSFRLSSIEDQVTNAITIITENVVSLRNNVRELSERGENNQEKLEKKIRNAVEDLELKMKISEQNTFIHETEASNQAAINSTMAYFDAEWGSLFNKHPNLSDLEELQDIFSQVKNKAMEFFENAPRMKNQKKEEEYRKDIRDRFIVRYLEAKRIVEANRIAKEEAENVQIEVQKREKEKLAYQQAIQKIQQKNTFEQQQLRKEMDLIEEESRKTELELAKKQKELIELQNHMQDATEQQRLQMSHMQQQMELRVAELQLQVNKQKRGFFVKVGDYFENLFS